MFSQNLPDLIKGIRNNKKDEARYIKRKIEAIQTEILSKDPAVKANALSKLTYLNMLGYDMSWASFNVVEVMSAPKYNEKRIGYLTATQSFNEETDVLTLTSNLIRKDLASADFMNVSLALESLGQIVNSELAVDLLEPVISTSYNELAFIRKKSVLVLFKILHKYPNSITQVLPIFKEKLDDSDDSVVSATATVICELAHDNPKIYLPLAPKLYKLLNDFNSNWMVIKIVKLFALLTPLEPRLAKKLYNPLAEIIQTTNKVSLLYESINTAVCGGILDLNIKYKDELGASTTLAELCSLKLEGFLSSNDPNLQYLGLVTLTKLQEKYPHLTSRYEPIVLLRLDVEDLSIRLRALEAIKGMISRENLMKIVNMLTTQLEKSATVVYDFNNAIDYESGPDDVDNIDVGTVDEPVYRKSLVDAIVSMCRSNSYSFVSNFDWLISVYENLALYALVDGIDETIADAILDATVRVQMVRGFSVFTMFSLIENCVSFNHQSAKKKITLLNSNSQMTKTLGVAAFILGEYGGNHLQSQQQLVAISNIFEVIINFKLFSDVVLGQLFLSLTKLLLSLFGKFVDSVYSSNDSTYNEIVEEFFAEFDGKLTNISEKFSKLGVTGSLSSFSRSDCWCREAGLLIWIFSIIKLNFHKTLFERKNAMKSAESPDKKENASSSLTHFAILDQQSTENPFSHSFERKLKLEDNDPIDDKDSTSNVNEMDLMQLNNVLQKLFTHYELKPMSSTAQSKIEPPNELLLSSDFNSPENYVPNTINELKSQFSLYDSHNDDSAYNGRDHDHRGSTLKLKNRNNGSRYSDVDSRYYLGSKGKQSIHRGMYNSGIENSDDDYDQIDSIPIISLDLEHDLSKTNIDHTNTVSKTGDISLSHSLYNTKYGTKVVIEEDETHDIQVENKKASISNSASGAKDLVLKGSWVKEFSLDASKLLPVLSTTLVKKKDFSLRLLEQNVVEVHKDIEGGISLVKLQITMKGKVKSKYIQSIKIKLYLSGNGTENELLIYQLDRANNGFNGMNYLALEYSLSRFPVQSGSLKMAKPENKSSEHIILLPILYGPIFVSKDSNDFLDHLESLKGSHGQDYDLNKVSIKFNVQASGMTKPSDFRDEIIKALALVSGINFSEVGNLYTGCAKKLNLAYALHGASRLHSTLDLYQNGVTSPDRKPLTNTQKLIQPQNQKNNVVPSDPVLIYGELEIYKFKFEIDNVVATDGQTELNNINDKDTSSPVNFVIAIRLLSSNKLWLDSVANSISAAFNLS